MLESKIKFSFPPRKVFSIEKGMLYTPCAKSWFLFPRKMTYEEAHFSHFFSHTGVIRGIVTPTAFALAEKKEISSSEDIIFLRQGNAHDRLRHSKKHHIVKYVGMDFTRVGMYEFIGSYS